MDDTSITLATSLCRVLFSWFCSVRPFTAPYVGDTIDGELLYRESEKPSERCGHCDGAMETHIRAKWPGCPRCACARWSRRPTSSANNTTRCSPLLTVGVIGATNDVWLSVAPLDGLGSRSYRRARQRSPNLLPTNQWLSVVRMRDHWVRDQSVGVWPPIVVRVRRQHCHSADIFTDWKQSAL